MPIKVNRREGPPLSREKNLVYTYVCVSNFSRSPQSRMAAMGEEQLHPHDAIKETCCEMVFLFWGG